MCVPHVFFFFFFNDTATTEIYTLSLHDALPISLGSLSSANSSPSLNSRVMALTFDTSAICFMKSSAAATIPMLFMKRSEEHTSELQSRQYLVCRLLLEKKKHKRSGTTSFSLQHL